MILMDPLKNSDENLNQLIDLTRLSLLIKRHGIVIGLGLFVLHDAGLFTTLIGGVC